MEYEFKMVGKFAIYPPFLKPLYTLFGKGGIDKTVWGQYYEYYSSPRIAFEEKIRWYFSFEKYTVYFDKQEDFVLAKIAIF